MNDTPQTRFVGVYPADGGDVIGYCSQAINTEVSLETQIEQAIPKLGLEPGNYIAVSQLGLLGTKTLTHFTVRVPEPALEVVL